MKMPALVDLTCREITDWVTDYMTEGVMQPEERAQFDVLQATGRHRSQTAEPYFARARTRALRRARRRPTR
jgi:hypothetical protein